MLEQKVKPVVELKKLDIVVNTTNAKEINNLMNVLELYGKINWPLSKSPREDAVSESRIAKYGENTCINLNKGQHLTWGSKDIYIETVSFQQFCELNNITQDKLNEITSYFK